MKYHIVMTSGRSYDILANTIAEAFRKADLLEIKTHDTVRLLERQETFTKAFRDHPELRDQVNQSLASNWQPVMPQWSIDELRYVA
jgi:hypothetical protein